jgi:hypothetical protein
MTATQTDFKDLCISAVDDYHFYVERHGAEHFNARSLLLEALNAAQELLNERGIVTFEEYAFTECHWGAQDGEDYAYCMTHDQGFPCPHAKS